MYFSGVEPSVTNDVLDILHSYPEKAVKRLISVQPWIKILVSRSTNTIGGVRLVDLLGEDQVPRIC